MAEVLLDWENHAATADSTKIEVSVGGLASWSEIATSPFAYQGIGAGKQHTDTGVANGAWDYRCFTREGGVDSDPSNIGNVFIGLLAQDGFTGADGTVIDTRPLDVDSLGGGWIDQSTQAKLTFKLNGAGGCRRDTFSGYSGPGVDIGESDVRVAVYIEAVAVAAGIVLRNGGETNTDALISVRITPTNLQLYRYAVENDSVAHGGVTASDLVATASGTTIDGVYKGVSVTGTIVDQPSNTEHGILLNTVGDSLSNFRSGTL